MKSQQYITTQRTAKTFKLQSLLSGLLIFIGVIMALQVDPNSTDSTVVVWGCLLALFGFGWRIVNRVRVWWNHD